MNKIKLVEIAGNITTTSANWALHNNYIAIKWDIYRPNAFLMLLHQLRCWPNIKPAHVNMPWLLGILRRSTKW